MVWFLRLGAPCFAGHLTKLFNISLQESTVPLQWKNSVIKPIPKIKNPSAEKDFRPISITPVLSRVMEKLVVRNYIYPAILDPPDPLTFDDQFAFRPIGSTTAAMIFLFERITELLLDNSLIFFYSARHLTRFVTQHSLRNLPCWRHRTKFTIGSRTTTLHDRTALHLMAPCQSL